VDAAIRILVTDGTRKLTAEHIAAEVGVTSGAIFRHFPSMEAIVNAAIEHIDAVLFKVFPRTAEDPLKLLDIFFNHRVRAIVENPNVSRMLLSDHLAHAAGRGRSRRIEGLKKRSSEFVLECLLEAESKGRLKGRAGPRILDRRRVDASLHYQSRVADVHEEKGGLIIGHRGKEEIDMKPTGELIKEHMAVLVMLHPLKEAYGIK
jgi:AcrR family transcriptional regulator